MFYPVPRPDPEHAIRETIMDTCPRTEAFKRIIYHGSHGSHESSFYRGCLMGWTTSLLDQGWTGFVFLSGGGTTRGIRFADMAAGNLRDISVAPQVRLGVEG